MNEWALVEGPSYQILEARVQSLNGGTGSVLSSGDLTRLQGGFQKLRKRVDDLEAEGLEETLQETKKTAARLDQRAPADLKMWSNEALKHLAGLTNLIEKQGRWPKQMQFARVASPRKTTRTP